MNRRPLRITLYVLALLLVGAVATLAPVDRTPIKATGFYNSMLERLRTAEPIEGDGELQTAWSRVSITPGYQMPMAGYAPRDAFLTVHDSLFARILTVTGGDLTVSFVSVDLLLFPPALRDRLTQKLDSAKVDDHLYLSATHTHNGVGGWDNSFVGKWSLGSYDEQWVESSANAIMETLSRMEPKRSSIRYWQSDAEQLVENRVDPEHGDIDGTIRGIEIVRDDGSKAIVYAFSAHPTSIDRYSRELSGDYPGALSVNLEREYNFAMFMAGMVGSHRLASVPHTDFDLIAFASRTLSDKISARQQDSVVTTQGLSFLSVPIEFGPSQLRISDGWKVRDWLFRSVLHRLQGNVDVVEIGDLIFIGLPCDFSGEVFKVAGLSDLAAASGKHLIITSFNGDYDGYITLDKHYEVSRAEEIRTLNWVGPGYGEYFSDIVKAVIKKTE